MRHHRTPPVPRVCQTCGASFTAFQADIRKGGGKFCSPECYSRRPNAERTPLADRFWPKVDRSAGPDACWPWTAYRLRGYGRVKATINGRARSLAHVVAYILTYGEPPAETPCVLHRCDNPPCCNPSHLFLGTSPDNNADRHRKGRSNTCRGEASPNAKLTAIQVRQIRATKMDGVTATTVAANFGVGQTTILDIWNGKRWRSV